ncbi:MAG TPA: AbrB/MazE/SpoVT family DNA-binding domain-containing protein [Armatimonadota bacterium]|nr:AbrB/MazE/SpoVT family DNA-binding domain-containing protein [Armatimonadota bacterium]HOS43462.1 AbrB/MazE/SpoVT family DNA-binding domain-containing protein [Armatimonadota bacterium]
MPDLDIERFFYGSATLGERGQVVIPADARKDCDIQPGDKVLVFRHPLHPHMLILVKIGEMQELLQQMGRTLEQAAARMDDTTTVPDEG